MDGAPGLPVSSADADCTLSIGSGERTTTSIGTVDGAVEGTVTITGLLVLGVGDSILKSLGATKTSFCRTPAVIPRSRSVRSCVRNGFLNAVPDHSCITCSNAATIVP